MKRILLYVDFIILPLLITFLSTHSGLISYYPADKKNTILELNNTPKGTVTALYTDQSTSEQQTIPPSPSLEQKLGQFDPTYIDKATFTVDFREPIESGSFTAVDIILAGTTGTVTSLEMVSPLNENRVFEFTVTGMTAGDTVTASLPANMVEYPNGDSNLAATSIDATVHYMGPPDCAVLGLELGEVITNRLNSDINLSPEEYNYGVSIANIGDLDRDGIVDIAVGNPLDNTGGNNKGAVYIYFMDSDGTVKQTKEINNNTDNGPSLIREDRYGFSIANIGDINGDGITDIAIGATGDDIHFGEEGAVHIHFMNSDGAVKGTKTITSGSANVPAFAYWDFYGTSIANIGDLNGDGITDIAVGATFDDTGGRDRGAVYIHFMDIDGFVKDTKKIINGDIGTYTISRRDRYGFSIANIGDLNEDGITDIAVGAIRDNTGGLNRGAVYIHFMDSDGTVKKTHKIASGTDIYGPDLSNEDYYGSSIANIGDINGDGITDIAVGAIGDDTGGDNRGAVYIHLMNRNASVKKTFKIDDSTEGVDLPNGANYGRAITNMGNPDGNGTITMAVGTKNGDSKKGVVYFSKIQFVCSPLSPALEQKLGQFDPTYIDKATFTVDFREPIDSGSFTADDITLTVDDITQAGTTETIKNIKNVSPLNENRVFEFTVTGMTAGDTVTASLEAGVVEYSGGSTNLKATSIDATVHYMGPPDCGVLGLGEVTTNRLSNIDLSNGDLYDYSIANIGNLDADDITDIAVGNPLYDTEGGNGGAVYIHFMNSDGTIKETEEINDGTPNGPNLLGRDKYGSSIANIGDLNEDGIVDIAVGAVDVNRKGTKIGVVHIHFMNSDGSVHETEEINDDTPNGPNLLDHDRYGSSIANIGDLNRDGITDIVVGARRDDTGNTYDPNNWEYNKGVVYIHFMNSNGTVKETKEINDDTPNGPKNLRGWGFYGSSVANIGDLDADGITDIAVGAPMYDDDGGELISLPSRGIIYIHFMKGDGTVRETKEINDGTPNGPNLRNKDRYGYSIANIGDINGDGITDIAVGAIGDDTGGNNRGAVYIHLMNRDGGVKKTFKIDNNAVGVDLPDNANYGRAITNMGNPDGNGNITIAVGSNEAIYLSDIQFICLPPSLEQKLGQFDPTYIDKATFRVDFREPINPTTFTVDDITLTGTGTVTSLEMVSPLNENRVFEFTVTGMTVGDTVTASLAAKVVNYSTTGASNQAATSIDASVRYAERHKCGVPVFDIVPNSNRKIDKELVATISANNYYGFSIANIGDLDGDHIDDIAVGAIEEGAVYIHFMNSDGDIRETRKITSGTPNGPNLTNDTNYGSSIANIGDLDEDGIVDIAVGDKHNGTGGPRRGAVYIHFMNSDGSVKKTHKITSGTDVYGPNLSDWDIYGLSIANIGDLNGDGITDIAVGVGLDDMGGHLRANIGDVYIHFMNSNGTIKQTQKISTNTINGPNLSNGDYYGTSIANIGDLNGDGIIDIAVGATGDDTGGNNRGAVYIHLMNRNASVKKTFKIDDSENTPNGPYLTNGDLYGISIANMGDLDGDGIVDIVVGAVGDVEIPKRETLYLHFLRTDGSIKSTVEINKNTINNSTYISQGDHYGRSIANMGDPDGDGIMDMVVGARKTNSNDGAVYFSSFGMYCPKYMRHGKYFLNGTLRFKKSLK